MRVEINGNTKIEDEIVSPLGNYYGRVSVARVDGKPCMLLGGTWLQEGVEITEALYTEFARLFKDASDEYHKELAELREDEARRNAP